MKTQSLPRATILASLLGFVAMLAMAPAALAEPSFGLKASLIDPQAEVPPERKGPVPDRYIVFFKDSVKAPASLARTQTENRNAKLGFVYRLSFKGYSAEMTKAQVQGLREDARVDFIAPDREVEAFAQSTPTGIDRVFATANKTLAINEEDDIRIDADIAVIDTGTDHQHPDLDVVARTDCSKGTEQEASCEDESGTDNNGHGTHVAGTAAAIDNDYGVVGVAPGARIWAVKVLGSGTNYDSEIAAGIEWVTARAEDIDVANMSLGCGCALPATAKAIESSVEAGVVYVVSAGNSETDAQFAAPANHPDVITVSAVADFDGKPGGLGADNCTWWGDTDDTLAAFSNYGSIVDVAAPGVCIKSTLPGNSYGFNHGTSMASPHVAGAAAILAALDKPESAEDVEAIRDTIVEEGNFDWEDTSPDWIHEPLLDVGDEAVFFGADVPTVPTVHTSSATDVNLSEATLNGTINPKGLETEYHFEYGTTTEYGASAPVPAEAIGDGTEDVKVSEPIEGLEPETTYHFRVVAINEEGVRYGKDRSFTTYPGPGVQTEAATDVTLEGATLHGTVEPEAGQSYYQFEYGTTTDYGISVPVEPKWVGESFQPPVHVKEELTGLEPETTYHFRVVALNGDLEVDRVGKDRTFTTIPAPLVQVEAATGIGKTTATLNGTVDPRGFETTYRFEYGTSTAYGKTAPVPDGELGEEEEGAIEVPETLTDLKPETTYHFRLIATNGGGTTKGKDATFETAPRTPPLVQTKAAASVSKRMANLKASVNPQGFATSYQFEYGKTTEYGSKAPVSPQGVGSGTEAVEVAQLISGLEPETTYHFRVVASSEEGTSYGEDVTFTTAAPTPSVATYEAQEVAGRTAILPGHVNPEGLSTTYYFEYGAGSAAGGTKVPASPKSAGSGTSNVPVSEEVDGLEPGTTYHFRLVATNSKGTTYGGEASFTPVATKWATKVDYTEATLNGLVNPDEVETEYWFEYGTTAEYGEAVGHGLLSEEEEANENIAVSEKLTGLEDKTTYHYRVVAKSMWSEEIRVGEDMTFTTGPSVTFVDEGVPLELGTEVRGTSGDLIVIMMGGTLECNSAEFVGELIDNESNGATLEPIGDLQTTGCSVNGVHKMEVSLGLAPVRFFSDSLEWGWKADVGIESGEISIPAFGLSCQVVGDSDAASPDYWGPWSEANSSLYIRRQLSLAGEGCPSAEVRGGFNLTLTDETPIQAIFDER